MVIMINKERGGNQMCHFIELFVKVAYHYIERNHSNCLSVVVVYRFSFITISLAVTISVQIII